MTDRSHLDLTDDIAAYLPTPEEIQQKCEEIRATWTKERWHRACGRNIGNRYEFPSITNYVINSNARWADDC